MSNTNDNRGKPCSRSKTTAFLYPSQICEQAEQKAQSLPIPDLDNMTREEILQMLYETQVNQIKADLQVEQLCSQLEERHNQADLFSIVTDNMLDLVSLSDMEGNFTFAGKSHETLGYSPGFLIGKNVMDFVHPEDFPRILEAFNEFVASGHPRRGEYRYRCEDGTYLWLETIGNFFGDESGAPHTIVFSSRNITERKQAEEALQERLSYEQLLSRVSVLAMETDDLNVFQNKCLKTMGETLDLSRIYIFEHHHETDTMDNTFEWVAEGVSPQKDELQGVSAADIPWWMKVLKSNQVINFADIEAIPDEGVKTILRPQRILSILVVPLFTTGQYYGFLGFDDCVRHREWSDTDAELLQAVGRIITGVVEQKRAEEALKESEELLDATGFMARVGGWQLDVETTALTWTKETYHIHEVPLNYKPLLDMAIEFFHPDDRDVLSQAIQRALDRCEPYDMELRFITAKGNNLWTRTTCQPEVVGGKTVRLRGTFQDITERKQAEEEREKLQKQLAQAQKMESVGRLAGGVAHDFNNKLSIINGYAEMSLDMLDPGEPVYENLKEIYSAGKRSANIVRQLLAFARQQTISPLRVDLNYAISDMLKMLQRLIGENIDLAWHPGINLWHIKIDPSQLDQIMANLAVNARDAIADVGRLTIETKNVVADEDYCRQYSYFVPGRYVMLAVSDNGCGMEKQVQDNLFEPFFTTKEVGKGTGLGLSTIYGIVKQNKGFINVYSEPGEGTTFKIYLPPDEEFESGSLPHLKESAKQIPTGSETVLLVEDEPAILKMGKGMLEKLGYTVLTAEKPGDALLLAEEYEGRIHLLITDVIMPEMNGRDLFTKLSECSPGLKSIYMSGYTAEVIAHHGVLDQGVHFIQKPFSIQYLAVKVREAIEQE